MPSVTARGLTPGHCLTVVAIGPNELLRAAYILLTLGCEPCHRHVRTPALSEARFRGMQAPRYVVGGTIRRLIG
jgi:hypothetical protein